MDLCPLNLHNSTSVPALGTANTYRNPYGISTVEIKVRDEGMGLARQR